MIGANTSSSGQQALKRDGLLALCRSNDTGLSFDPHVDPPQFTDGLLRDYLRFYGLNFDEMIPGLTARSGCRESAGYAIATHYWLPVEPRGTAFIVHGYFDHVGLYRHLIRHLLEQNFAVVAFDLPGHGLSSGERVSIASFDRYVEVFAELLDNCQERLPQPWHGVGQSTGASILLKYVMRADSPPRANPFATASLLCPLIRPVGWNLSIWLYRLSHRWRTRVPRYHNPSSHDDDFLDFIARRDPLQDHYISVEWVGAMKRWIEEFLALPPCDYPFHIIQGTADTTVDWRYNLRQLKGKLTGARYTMIDDARHQLVNESPEIRQQVFKTLALDAVDSSAVNDSSSPELPDPLHPPPL